MASEHIIRSNRMLLPGMVVFRRKGKIVWYGRINDPWEDVVWDTLDVSPEDYGKFQIGTKGEERGTCK